MRPKRNQSLGIRRIVAGALVLIWLGINAAGILYVSLEHKLVEETFLAVTEEQGRAWSRLCAERIKEGERAPLQHLVDALGQGRDIRRAWVADQAGVVIADTESDHIGRRVELGELEFQAGDVHVEEQRSAPGGFFHEAGHDFRLRFPIRRDGERLGTLALELNTAWGNLEAKALAVKGIVTLLAITIGFALVAFWVDRGLVRGIRQLTDAIRGIADGQLDPRVRLGTGDELDELGDSVNIMADALRQSEDRVRHWKEQLEQVVAARTEQLEASQALLAQREKMAALGLMAAGVAHEVGNPLSAISAIVQRLELSTEPKLRDKCRTIRQQIERISKTIDELRLFARPARARGDAPVNANEVLRLSLQVCRYDPRGKRVTIATNLDPDLPPIWGHADRWQQVFLNLIFNAFDAMPEGGTLTVISKRRNERVELVFQDTGVGMSAQQIRKLFHPFYSTKPQERASGLGLSVCEGIVRGYSGVIHVDSEPGRGSEFSIEIPPFQRPASEGESALTAGSDGTAVSPRAGRSAQPMSHRIETN